MLHDAPAPPSWPRTKAWTRSWTPSRLRLGGCEREPHDREHGRRPRLDLGLSGRAVALPEHALRAAVRALRRRDVPRLRRAGPRRLLREAAHLAGASCDRTADAAGLRPGLRE